MNTKPAISKKEATRFMLRDVLVLPNNTNLDIPRVLNNVLSHHPNREFYYEVCMSEYFSPFLIDLYWLIYHYVFGTSVPSAKLQKIVARLGERIMKVKYNLQIKRLKIVVEKRKKSSKEQFAEFTFVLARTIYKLFRVSFPYHFFSSYWRKCVYLYVRRWMNGNLCGFLFAFENRELDNFRKWKIDTSFKELKPKQKKFDFGGAVRARLNVKKFIRKSRRNIALRKMEKQWKNYLKSTNYDPTKVLRLQLNDLDRKLEKSAGSKHGRRNSRSRSLVMQSQIKSVVTRHRLFSMIDKGSRVGSRRGSPKKELKKGCQVREIHKKVFRGKKRASVATMDYSRAYRNRKGRSRTKTVLVDRNRKRHSLLVYKDSQKTSPLVSSFLYKKKFFQSGSFMEKLDL